MDERQPQRDGTEQRGHRCRFRHGRVVVDQCHTGTTVSGYTHEAVYAGISGKASQSDVSIDSRSDGSSSIDVAAGVTVIDRCCQIKIVFHAVVGTDKL